jgi:DNA-binding transcriptional regulator YhcF (GntR family)
MESRARKTLLLIEAIEGEEFQSQRDLSRKLNISLGLVNTFIKNLTAQGIFKIVNGPKSKVQYLLTPLGAAEKTKLTKEYLAYSIDHYKEIKKRVSEILSFFTDAGKTRLVLYGAGEITEIACMTLCEAKIKDLKIIDDEKAGKKICGITIYAESTMHNIDFDAIVVMDFENNSIISRDLVKKGVLADKIFSIYSQLPVLQQCQRLHAGCE